MGSVGDGLQYFLQTLPWQTQFCRCVPPMAVTAGMVADFQQKLEKFTNLLKAQGAEIVNEENWGLRKLAYPIDKKTTGFYQLVEFKADPSVIATLEVNFRRDERVIRFLTFRQDKYAAEYAAKRRNLKASKETVKEN